MTKTLSTPDASFDQMVDPSLSQTPAMHWPERYEPSKAQVFVSNEIIIPTSADVIWAWLLRAELWPAWYANATNIHFLSHAGPNLRDRSRFRWQTSGARITSKVREFEPERRIAWDVHGIGIEGWQGWVLTPLDHGHTHVLMQETQTGWRARLGKLLNGHRKYDRHQQWLEGLSEQAQTGLPAA